MLLAATVAVAGTVKRGRLSAGCAGPVAPPAALFGTNVSVAQSFGVAVKKQPNPDDGSYTVKHSTDLFLTTRDGQILSRFPLTSSAEEIVAATKTALEKLAVPSPVATATR